MWLPGTYQNGFAPRDGEPLYPSLWRGCVGAWHPGLGPTGLTLRDWSSAKWHGTRTSGGSVDVTSLGYAYRGDGTSYISLAAGEYIPAGAADFSYTIWFAHDIASSSDRWLVHQGLTGANAGNWALGIFNTAVKFLSWPDGGSSATASLTTSQSDMTVANAKWRHLAIVRNASDGVVSVYIDGIYEGTIAGQTGDLAANNNVREMRIGDAISNFPFAGRLTDIRLFTRKLDPIEITLLARRPGIAYELAPRRRTAAVEAAAAAYYNQLLMLGVG